MKRGLQPALCPIGVRVVVNVMRLEKCSAESWTEGQGNEAGDDGRSGDGYRELTEEQPGKAGDKGRRNEDGAKWPRNRDQRTADVRHRPMRGLHGRQARAH